MGTKNSRFSLVSLPIGILLVLSGFSFSGCDYLKSLTESRYRKRIGGEPASEKDIVNWKEKLALEEAEIEEMDKRIRKMVQKSNQSAALSWKIARAYMRAGSADLGARYYDEALAESIPNAKQGGFEIHSYESALPYFDKAIQSGKLDKQLLYETAVAYANASKDMGWESTRRSRAINLFKQLSKLDKEDSRFPFQLALVYFDSSLKDEVWNGKLTSGYDEVELAFSLLDQILRKEPYNVPTRFAKANFLYQVGKSNLAYDEYTRIKSILEEMKEKGTIRESLEENSSYRNVIKNLNQLGAQNKSN
ncbi:tetratricopeptide repeat protein [Leptospira vanthielii]|uniref:tetratricopeptide repeat protein n=1 Tax=Leptospira vanthielii TaxID=293085 RepID=UPI00058730AA|nr:tetratricopeptide repeat protein [Leptospira vanthielii]